MKAQIILVQILQNGFGITSLGVYMTPFGVIVRQSFSSFKRPGRSARLVTPRTFGLLDTIFPKQVEKHKLYAMIMEG